MRPKKQDDVVDGAKRALREADEHDSVQHGQRYWKFGKARPSRLETETTLSRDIFDLVCEGDSIVNAHLACGVSDYVRVEWARKAKDGQQPYADHMEACEIGKAIFQSASVRAVYKIGLGSLRNAQFQALAWLLERRNKDEFWLSKRIEVTGPDGSEFNAAGASMDDLKKLLEAIEEAKKA